jgi:hypothetical protein
LLSSALLPGRMTEGRISSSQMRSSPGAELDAIVN